MGVKQCAPCPVSRACVGLVPINDIPVHFFRAARRGAGAGVRRRWSVVMAVVGLVSGIISGWSGI
jgi:hypothetical protein